MLQRQTDSQTDGKPEWYLERTAFNETHNQIENCRQSAIGVIPWMKRASRGWVAQSQLWAPAVFGDLNLLSGLMPSKDFDLVCGFSDCDWLFRECFPIYVVRVNASSLHMPFCDGGTSRNECLALAQQSSVLSHMNVKMKFFVITKRNTGIQLSFYSLLEDGSFNLFTSIIKFAHLGKC